MLKELVADDLEQIALLSKDTDAKVGHIYRITLYATTNPTISPIIEPA